MTALKAPRRRVHWFKRDWRLYAMLAIPLIWYLLFCYKPMIGVMIAFQKYSLVKGMWGSKFVGLKNFEFVMGLRDFPLALQNTLYLNLLGLILGFPVPIILAIMLNEIRSKGVKRVSQTLLYLPHFLSWIIIGGMVLKIFAPTTGVVNATLLKWGLIDKNIPFLTDGPVASFLRLDVGGVRRSCHSDLLLSYQIPSSPSFLVTKLAPEIMIRPTTDWNRPMAVARSNLALVIPVRYTKVASTSQ